MLSLTTAGCTGGVMDGGLRSTAEAEGVGVLGAESSSFDHIPARKEASNE